MPLKVMWAPPAGAAATDPDYQAAAWLIALRRIAGCPVLGMPKGQRCPLRQFARSLTETSCIWPLICSVTLSSWAAEACSRLNSQYGLLPAMLQSSQGTLSPSCGLITTYGACRCLFPGCVAAPMSRPATTGHPVTKCEAPTQPHVPQHHFVQLRHV